MYICSLANSVLFKTDNENRRLYYWSIIYYPTDGNKSRLRIFLGFGPSSTSRRLIKVFSGTPWRVVFSTCTGSLVTLLDTFNKTNKARKTFHSELESQFGRNHRGSEEQFGDRCDRAV